MNRKLEENQSRFVLLRIASLLSARRVSRSAGVLVAKQETCMFSLLNRPRDLNLHWLWVAGEPNLTLYRVRWLIGEHSESERVSFILWVQMIDLHVSSEKSSPTVSVSCIILFLLGRGAILERTCE